jgi:hypothetical protein
VSLNLSSLCFVQSMVDVISYFSLQNRWFFYVQILTKCTLMHLDTGNFFQVSGIFETSATLPGANLG